MRNFFSLNYLVIVAVFDLKYGIELFFFQDADFVPLFSFFTQQVLITTGQFEPSTLSFMRHLSSNLAGKQEF